jgi:small subunit ribosomal protein S20|tara:strand:+ start:357 stop:620 length:264 start_codon:yes stop_codon:yes gene_type:complete
MANHKSSKKRILRNNKRNEINSNRISRIRTYIKKVETEISSENKDKANEAFKLAMPEIQRGVSKGLMHKNTASRKLSRLSNKIKSIK